MSNKAAVIELLITNPTNILSLNIHDSFEIAVQEAAVMACENDGDVSVEEAKERLAKDECIEIGDYAIIIYRMP